MHPSPASDRRTRPAFLCAPADFRAPSRAALVIGHPGHELLVYGWVSEMRPAVHIFTDGSGSGGSSRTEASRRILKRLDAPAGEVFSPSTDCEFYDAILNQRVSFFLTLRDRLAASFVEHTIDFVLSDAAEGMNPTHDLCGAIAGAAAAIAARTSGLAVAHYEFALVECLHAVTHEADEACAHLAIDEALLEEKLMAAQHYRGLNAEIHAALARHGPDYFRIECLRKAGGFPFARFKSSKPYYETYGERRRAEGTFPSVIRYREHVRPIVEAVLRQCDSGAQ